MTKKNITADTIGLICFAIIMGSITFAFAMLASAVAPFLGQTVMMAGLIMIVHQYSKITEA